MPWVIIDWAPCFGLLKHPKQDRRLIRRPMKGYRFQLHLFFVMSLKTWYLYVFVACVKLRVKIHVDISMAGVLVKISISPQRQLNFLIKGLRKKNIRIRVV
jgi:hypothetical protein